MSTRAVHITLITLGSLFLAYTGLLYSGQLSGKPDAPRDLSAGRLVWQQYNCQACHQLYGLGGYLGPDLTNFCADTVVAKAILESVLRDGVRQMPSFSMSEGERNELFAFLRSAHASGNADPRSFETSPDGMIHPRP